MDTFWIQNQVSHSPPPSIAIFPLPLLLRPRHFHSHSHFSLPFLVLETQNLEPSRTKKNGARTKVSKTPMIRIASHILDHSSRLRALCDTTHPATTDRTRGNAPSVGRTTFAGGFRSGREGAKSDMLPTPRARKRLRKRLAP